jgi:hypothetical protein
VADLSSRNPSMTSTRLKTGEKEPSIAITPPKAEERMATISSRTRSVPSSTFCTPEASSAAR